MPKIRGVKPELWTDENFVELSPLARLLWMGLWNFACDNGHVQDKSKQIKMRVLPTDDVNCAELLREIEAQRLIERADGWITIPNLSHHQKPHKRWWTTCDAPGCELPEGASHAPNNRGTTVAPPKGNRGNTGAHREDHGGATADGDGDGDCEVDSDGELKVMVSTPLLDKSSETDEPDRFEEFWDTYSHKVGRAKAEKAYRVALKKPGVTADLLIASAAAYITWQISEGKHPEFTKHPTTWLHGEHWRDERPARRPESPAGSSPNMQAHMRLVEQFAQAEGNVTPFPQLGGAS